MSITLERPISGITTMITIETFQSEIIAMSIPDNSDEVHWIITDKLSPTRRRKLRASMQSLPPSAPLQEMNIPTLSLI